MADFAVPIPMMHLFVPTPGDCYETVQGDMPWKCLMTYGTKAGARMYCPCTGWAVMAVGIYQNEEGKLWWKSSFDWAYCRYGEEKIR